MAQSLVIKIIQYTCISGVFMFSLLSLFVTERRKKLLFLFLMLLFSSIVGFLFYSGILIFLIGIIVMGFFITFCLFVFHAEKYEKKEKRLSSRILNVLLPLVLCFGIGYLFYNYTLEFFTEPGEVKGVSLISFESIISDLYANYLIVIVILILILFVSVLWFILILDVRGRQ